MCRIADGLQEGLACCCHEYTYAHWAGPACCPSDVHGVKSQIRMPCWCTPDAVIVTTPAHLLYLTAQHTACPGLRAGAH